MLQPFVVEVASESSSGRAPTGRGQLLPHFVPQLERPLEVRAASAAALEVLPLLLGHRSAVARASGPFVPAFRYA